MRNACDQCSRPFGLVRQRWLFHAFCSTFCKTEFLKTKTLMRQAFRARAPRLRSRS